MDRTLRRATGKSRRRQERNHGAWRRFAPDGVHCPYCGHDGSRHLITSSQPHFYRPATAAERRDPRRQLYRHELPGGTVLVARVAVARNAEIVTAFCTACADDLRTHQAMCFKRTRGVGEVVGLDEGDTENIEFAA